MNDKQKIEMNFQRAEKQATKLENAAQKLRKSVSRELESVTQSMSSVWQGESASAFYAKSKKVKSEVDAAVKSLESAASTIRSQARKVYNAEMTALNIANENKY